MGNATVGLGVVAGALLGGTLTWLAVRSGDAPADAPAVAPHSVPQRADGSERDRAGDVVRTAVDERGQPAPQADPQGAPPAAGREDGALVPAALLAWARTEVERGWRELRQDPVPAEVADEAMRNYRDQVDTLAHHYGRRAAEERNERDKKAALFAGDDAVALLAAIKGDEPEVPAFVQSDRFAALFQPRGGGSAVDGTSLGRDGRIPGGATVSFPAGVFAVADWSRGNEPYPADVTVRGAGMDATLLVWDAQGGRSPMLRFAIEDCTVFAGNAITDLRSHAAIIALRRVRIVGFDCGAGGSVAFYLSAGAALRASGCRFEGGYGRAPQIYANLLRVHGPCLARFEQCTFDSMSLDGAGARGVAFVDCTMHELLQEPPTRATYSGCRITLMPVEKRWDGDYRRRDLNTLFPQWQQRLQGR